jgi:hypothetical protein
MQNPEFNSLLKLDLTENYLGEFILLWGRDL